MSYDEQRKRRAYNANHRAMHKARRLRRRMEEDQKMAYGVRAPNGHMTKLTDKCWESICTLLAEGQTMEVAATLSGINQVTLYSWLRDGTSYPDGPFGQFARDVAYAKEVSHRYLVNKIVLHDDWKAAAFLLKNKFPKLYRDTFEQNISGPDGGPLTVQTFSVVLEMHKPEEHNDGREREPEREFRIDPLPSGAGNGAGESGAT
jgi:hypothetical protein